MTEVKLADEFNLDGRTVILIDTPGFDNNMKSDMEILNIMAAFLAAMYVRLTVRFSIFWADPPTDTRWGLHSLGSSTFTISQTIALVGSRGGISAYSTKFAANRHWRTLLSPAACGEVTLEISAKFVMGSSAANLSNRLSTGAHKWLNFTTPSNPLMISFG